MKKATNREPIAVTGMGVVTSLGQGKADNQSGHCAVHHRGRLPKRGCLHDAGFIPQADANRRDPILK